MSARVVSHTELGPLEVATKKHPSYPQQRQPGIIGRGPTAMADGYGRDLKAADRFTIITDFTKRSLQGNLSRF